ncbi:hypothetical protein [Tengunoibacter tsumagoiensis]|uniref:Uncharacterized protein n=1 Tax=Tengunoibacter tsumagoiensis TaxID=2014871 RepID=A0A402A2B9_9CHLR|nr:hypothetical protein [Tengunoibacter tsumagoiensis]GCE13308.1 hypothetical protein KTT_31670 [Tengunoibacter tsumagoiensis]
MTGFINADGSALVGGTTLTGLGQALQLDAQGNVLTQSALLASLQQGKGYTATTGLLNVAAGNYPLCIFNPASTGKTILIYSLYASSGTASVNSISLFLQTVTVNPSYPGSANVTPNRIGATPSALNSSCSYSNTSQTLTAPYAQVVINVTPIEFLSNGAILLLPPGTSTGFVVFLQTYASGFSSITARWLEL